MIFVLGDNIGFVSLIEHVGDDRSIVNSARVSFGKQINVVSEQDKKLIGFLLQHSHGTPLEHNSLTYLVKCPIFVARQWHRHRIGISINEISGRYVEMNEEFYLPPKLRSQSKRNRQVSQDGNFSVEEQNNLKSIFESTFKQAYQAYNKLLDSGVTREQARAVLPLSLYTQFYWTCNLRSLFHFVKLRDHEDAQFEIKQYAIQMLKFAADIFPITVQAWEDLKRP